MTHCGNKNEPVVATKKIRRGNKNEHVATVYLFLWRDGLFLW